MRIFCSRRNSGDGGVHYLYNQTDVMPPVMPNFPEKSSCYYYNRKTADWTN